MIQTVNNKLIRFFISIVILFTMIFACQEYGFAAIEPVNVKVPVTVTETAGGERVLDKFVFQMTSLTPGAPVPEQSTVKCGYLEKTDFVISFDKIGKYSYRVKQIRGSNKDIKKYDDTSYIVEILVYLKDNGEVGTVCAIKKENQDSKSDELTFKNPVKITKGKNIKTGDKANLLAWALLLVLSLSFMIGLVIVKIKKLKRGIAK